MIPLVKNDYIKVTGSKDTFTVIIDKLPNTFYNYYKESCWAAEEIYSLKTGQLHILYSGGLDSEYALSVFLELGMSITPVIIRFNNNYNQHDLKYALEFCQCKNIVPKIIDIDFDWFVTSGKILDIATTTRSSIHHRPATSYASGMIDGTVICGDGEPYIRLNSDNVWKIEIDENDYSVYNYMKMNNIPGTIHFNRFRAEQYAAWITDPRMNELANNNHYGKLGSNSSKHIIYNRHSPFQLTQRQKYTGYEHIEKSEIFKHPNITELYNRGKDYNGLVTIPYHDFIKNYV